MAETAITTQTGEEQNGGSKTPPAQAAPAEAQSQQPSFELSSLEGVDDATKLGILNKITGKDYKDLSEAIPQAQPTPEQILAQKEAKHKDATSWAIQNGKITPEQIEKVGAVKAKQDRQIALEIFTQDIREDNAKATDEEIEQLFQNFYHEDLDENDPQRRAALKRMSKEVAAYRAEVTGGYDAIEGEFDQTQQHAAQYSEYKSTIKAVSKELPTELTFDIPFTSSVDNAEHTFQYKYPIEDKIKDAIRKEYEHENVYNFLGSEVKPEAIKSEMLGAIYAKVYPEALKEILTQHAVAVETHTLAKAKSIPVTGHSSFVQPTKTDKPATPPVHSNFMAANKK